MSRKTPFHLVQLGAGTGIDLIADYMDREPLYSEEGGALPGPEDYSQCPYPILSRLGLDPSPAPDESEIFRSLSRDPAGPKLQACPWPDMPAMIASRLSPRPDEGLLVFSKEGRLDAAAIAGVLAPWGDVGFWAELAEGELRVHRPVAGEIKAAALARVEPKDGRFVLLKGWNFLQPSGPVKPQKVTIEEPPRRLG